jgi:hypothetical protein
MKHELMNESINQESETCFVNRYARMARVAVSREDFDLIEGRYIS